MSACLRVAALVLAAGSIGFPINCRVGYAALLLSAVLIFSAKISASPGRWAAAIAAVLVVHLGQSLFAPPPIEEGHNVFLVDEPRTPLARVLPADVHAFMAAEFARIYPEDRRCSSHQRGCWLNRGFPDTAYAFSADGIWQRAAMSRQVRDIDFADGVSLRLGFTNDLRYDWYPVGSDVRRASRDGRIWKGYDRWRLLMPWYVAYRFPSAYIGSRLCWTGTVLWESKDGNFAPAHHDVLACRVLAEDDIGRLAFGVAIAPDSLSMRLDPAPSLQGRQVATGAAGVLGVGAVVGVLLAGRRRRRTRLWALLIALACPIILLEDASLLGGFRPHDAGDDGLVYEGFGRRILQHLLRGDIALALQGEEPVFFFGGPGLRYLRAAERIVFGDTNLGYLSLLLLMPPIVFALFRRFMTASWGLGVAILFVLTPVGILFGTSYSQYVKFAARGYADPAAYIVFICGLLAVASVPMAGPQRCSWRALGGGALLALAVFLRPNLAPAAAVIACGAALIAFTHGQRRQAAAASIGFALVLVMPVHNWLFGNVWVPLSANSGIPQLLIMPPSAYVSAALELARLEVGDNVVRALTHLCGYLSGPSEITVMVPLHAAALIPVVHVVICGRSIDSRLRLIAVATSIQHAVGLFYPPVNRYYLLVWLLTLLVNAVWLREVGLPWLRSRAPSQMTILARSQAADQLSRVLQWFERLTYRRGPC
jgi:hypothetical protein